MNDSIMNKVKNISTKIRNFCWWSAGVVPTVLEKCPTNQMKYTAVGVIMVFIALLASVSFAFFLTQTFAMPFFIALLIGFVWGFLIYSLDRVILTSFRKNDTSRAAVIQRFILTIALSLIISEPLLIFMFRKEIALEMARTSQTVSAYSRRNATGRFQSEIDALETANNNIESRLDALKADRDEKEKAVIGEIEGISGSGKKGKGIAADRKDEAFREAKEKYVEFKTDSAVTLSENKARLAEIRAEIENEIKNISAARTEADGVLAKHEALFGIVKSQPGAALVYLPLFFGLLFLETLPLSTKVFGKKSVYDAALEAVEDEAFEEIISEKNLLQKMRKAVGDRISDAVAENRIEDLRDADEREIAGKLKAGILRNLGKRTFSQNGISAKSPAKFGREITVEVVGFDDLQIRLQLPENVRREIPLDELQADIQNIANETGSENLKLAKAFSSKGHEIWKDLPLLPQLENDQKLVLQFEPETIY